MVRPLILLLALALLMAAPATAQSEEDESFQNELSYGVNFNSNGGLIGGASLKSRDFVDIVKAF